MYAAFLTSLDLSIHIFHFHPSFLLSFFLSILLPCLLPFPQPFPPSLHPSLPLLPPGLAMIYLQEYDEAIRLFTQLVQLNPANEPAQRQLQELHKYKQKEAAKEAQAANTTDNSVAQAANATQKSDITEKSNATQE